MSKKLEWLEKEKAIQDMMARTQNNVGKHITPKSYNTLLAYEESQEGDLKFTIRRILIAPLVFLDMMGLSENQAKIIYFSLIGVGGYFAYKKFKK